MIPTRSAVPAARSRSRAHPAQVCTVADVGTAANWMAGEDVFLLPSLDEEQAVAQFPAGFSAIKPYMRITTAPETEDEAAAAAAAEAAEGKARK